MKNKLDVHTIGLSLSLTSGILYLVCVFLFFVAPNFTLLLFREMFHGIDITLIARSMPPLINTFGGLVITLALSYVAGALFAEFYNKLEKRK